MTIAEPVAPIEITPRNIDFELDASHINDWLGGSKELTAFWNALSMLFPVGERFFVATVSSHRNLVTDPRLKAEVKAFVQQEALHTREHMDYNEALSTVLDSTAIEKQFDKHVAMLRKFFGELRSLMATCGFEHFTAILAEAVLENDAYMRGARADYEKVWRWHALEELEHKAVAYDVMLTATKDFPKVKTTAMRALAMAIVTEEFIRYATYRTWMLFKAQRMHLNPLAWAKLWSYLFVYPGFVRHLIPIYLKYYAADFHPNDIDNRATLKRVRKEIATYA